MPLAVETLVEPVEEFQRAGGGVRGLEFGGDGGEEAMVFGFATRSSVPAQYSPRRHHRPD
jgi:hypothetical protein